MTPPDTNPQRQVRRHRPSVLALAAGLAGVVLIAIVILGIHPADNVTRDAPRTEAGTETGAGATATQ